MSSATFILFLLFLLLLIIQQSSIVLLLLFFSSAKSSHNRPRQKIKYFINIAIILRTSFKKLYPVFFSQSQTLLMGNFPLRLQVCLRSNKDHIYLRLTSLLDLVDPRLNMIETHRIRNRISKYDPMSPLIERFSDISEPLLACSIPYIESDLSAIKLDSLYLEIHSYCAKILGLKGVLAVSNQQTSLSHTAVTNNQVFYCQGFLGRHFYVKIIEQIARKLEKTNNQQNYNSALKGFFHFVKKS